MKKSLRQVRLEQLITEHAVSTQEELLNLLHAENIQATQATISRDIRELKIVKARDANGQLRYTIYHADDRSQEQRLKDTMREVGLSITQVQFMNIIKTLPSNGNLLAAIIDELDYPQIVGTLAGHDTIVIISRSEAEASMINELMQASLVTVE